MTQFAKKLRGILEKAGKLDGPTGEALLAEALSQKRPFTEVLVKKGVATEHELVALIARAANIPPIDLSRLTVNKEVLESVPEDVAREYCIFPVDKIGSIITVAVANPFDVLKLDDIRIITGCQLRLVVSTAEEIEKIRGKGYQKESESVDGILGSFDDADVELKETDTEEEGTDLSAISDEDSPIVKLVNKMILDACNTGASDIHIEPFEKKVIVRYRKDGSMAEVMTLPKRMQNNITSRIKIMSKLDIAEKRKPQDGKFQMKIGNKAIDFRVSILPVVWGEKTVFRVLDSSNLALDIKSLGFEPKAMEDYLWACAQPYGMILVTGPTGSGKSTTLYSAVKHIAAPDINLVTVEDPVEYQLEGINQVPVNVKAGLTFGAALRSILRQDPDVVLLGEIRDQETLEIAVKAALTGHQVLSTLHTNDAPSTITRMVDMGMDPFMVASSTLVICAQRLARKLCTNCKKRTELPKDALLRLGFTEAEVEQPMELYEPVGCPRCNHGYKGRFALLETMRMTEPIKRMVVERAHIADVKTQALKEGMLTLRRCGLLNAARGKTSLQEIEASTMAD
ncbi:MAG: Flp pilus assembly complex ATPase component TadA [Planctomycetes bacterium]|jgi:type IV pilus assembly protein PilB|nr:Flp pilus assembly complex ATPase component TadA [Planctomycetota bacterium]